MRLLRLLLALGLSTALLAACGDGEDAPDPSAAVPMSPTPSVPTATPSPAVEPSSTGEDDPRAIALVLGLCSVEADLAADDVESAEATFEDEVHDPLHEIGDEVEEVDRGTAADLLEAKQRVESGFAEPAPAAELTAEVEVLLEATWAALEALGLGAPACPA